MDIKSTIEYIGNSDPFYKDYIENIDFKYVEKDIENIIAKIRTRYSDELLSDHIHRNYPNSRFTQLLSWTVEILSVKFIYEFVIVKGIPIYKKYCYDFYVFYLDRQLAFILHKYGLWRKEDLYYTKEAKSELSDRVKYHVENLLKLDAERSRLYISNIYNSNILTLINNEIIR